MFVKYYKISQLIHIQNIVNWLAFLYLWVFPPPENKV